MANIKIGRGTVKFNSNPIQGQGGISTAKTNGNVAQQLVNKATDPEVIKKALGGAIKDALPAAQNKVNKLAAKFEQQTGLRIPRPRLKDLIGLGYKPANLPPEGGWWPLIRGRADPLMTMHWLPEFPLGLAPEMVEEIQFNEPSIQASSGIFLNGSHFYLPESISVTAVSVVFYEDRLMTVSNWLQEWKQLITPDGRRFNYPIDFKLPIRVYVKDVKGITVGQFCIHGAWPSTFPARNFASEGSERVRLTVEFTCDKITFQKENVREAESPLSSVTGDVSRGISLFRNGFPAINNFKLFNFGK